MSAGLKAKCLLSVLLQGVDGTPLRIRDRDHRLIVLAMGYDSLSFFRIQEDQTRAARGSDCERSPKFLFLVEKQDSPIAMIPERQ